MVTRLEVDIELPLDSFNLAVEFQSTGGITALFGPSGAGKTLTLRSVAGLMRPTRGKIGLGSEVLLDTVHGIDQRPQDRRIGYLSQQYALFPHLDVGRNIGFGIQQLDRQSRRARIGELLSLVQLEGFERRAVRELSGGQQQRVALARALAPAPRLLLLDEPFAAIDAGLRRRLRRELLRIHQITATPMLLVTHDLEEVRQLADHLILLDQGRVVGAGPTGELLSEPPEARFAEILGFD